MNIAVIGAGSWGTALACMLGENHSVSLWVRTVELANKLSVTRKNDYYLPEVKIPQSLYFTNDMNEAVEKAGVIFLVTPSHTIREIARKLAYCNISAQTIIVSAAKGLEIGTYKRMSEVIRDELPSFAARIAVLSGPNHAEEVGLHYPSATVVAASSRKVAETVQAVLMTAYFRAYTNSDMLGVELAGALKNIIALGAGIADGLGFGDNTKAALMTRGLTEISRLGLAMNAKAHTFAGLAGIGDLIATCTSKHSRNRWAGMMLAQGKTPEEIQTETHMVVEGIRSTNSGYCLAQLHDVSMPITEAIYEVLYTGKSPRDAVLELMNRDRTYEMYLNQFESD